MSSTAFAKVPPFSATNFSICGCQFLGSEVNAIAGTNLGWRGKLAYVPERAHGKGTSCQERGIDDYTLSIALMSSARSNDSSGKDAHNDVCGVVGIGSGSSGINSVGIEAKVGGIDDA